MLLVAPLVQAQPPPTQPPAPAEEQPADEQPAKEEPAEEEPAEEEPPEEEPEPAAPSEPLVDPRAVERKKQEDAQAAREKDRPREPLVDIEAPDAPAWERHLEIGASFAFVLRPFAQALAPTDIAYGPAPGFGVHLQWPVFSWLRFHPYFIHAFHSLDIPQGALQSATALSISADATVADARVATFVLGAKIAPTLNFTDRWRGWVTAGVGWGRFEFPTMTVTEPGGATYTIRDRAGVIVEFPLGLGIAFDVIERWMSIHYEATAAPITGQSGNAHEVFQAVDADGTIRDVGAFGAIEASFVQTLGVSLIL